MAADTGEQVQEFCRILVLTDEGEGGENAQPQQCGLQLQSQTVPVNSLKSADAMGENSKPFSSSPRSIPEDIEKGTTDMSKIDQDTCGSIKNEIALTKPLRRQNSLQTGGESIPPLMNHILMLLKIDPKEKQTIDRAHEAANNKWRKYKRAASFDSRQIVLLFSILSSMGTLVLIYLTLRVRQISDGYIHG